MYVCIYNLFWLVERSDVVTEHEGGPERHDERHEDQVDVEFWFAFLLLQKTSL